MVTGNRPAINPEYLTMKTSITVRIASLAAAVLLTFTTVDLVAIYALPAATQSA
jgi:hypothetical protein